MTIRILLVEPSTLLREGLRHLLPSPDFEIVAEMRSHYELAIHPQAVRQADLILFDAHDHPTVMAGIRAIRETVPSARIVHLANALDPDLLLGAFEAGADGVISKDRSPEAVIQNLLLVMMGEKVMPQDAAEMLLRRPILASQTWEPCGLSRREGQILGQLLIGASNKAIANGLGITEATVKVHLKGLLRKIGCMNRTQAAIWGLNNGFGASMQAEGAAATA
ncbi:MAG TPA: response regulator transcription factor [Azospirillaceae bacterium]|nr:response regulator transcription factor [Azospirillaceae bacterium]